MEESNYKSIHIISEAIIVGGLSIYVYKKISELESTVEELKQQIAMQNNQLRYLLGANSQRTPLRIPNGLPPFDTMSVEGVTPSCSSDALQKESQGAPSAWFTSNKKMECNGGVCTLSSAAKCRRDPQDIPHANRHVEPGRNDVMMATCRRQEDKKVVISKISKQIEFDRENNDLDQSLKVNTFTKFSPNPVIKSVTPKPSTSSITTDNDDETNELDNILNEIDNE